MMKRGRKARGVGQAGRKEGCERGWKGRREIRRREGVEKQEKRGEAKGSAEAEEKEGDERSGKAGGKKRGTERRLMRRPDNSTTISPSPEHGK